MQQLLPFSQLYQLIGSLLKDVLVQDSRKANDQRNHNGDRHLYPYRIDVEMKAGTEIREPVFCL